MRSCPICGSVESWHFWPGEMNAPGDRFDKAEPDTGNCTNCGFAYNEHIDHPLAEQITEFELSDVTRKGWNLNMNSLVSVSVKKVVISPEPTRFCFVSLQNLTFVTRLKLVLALLVTPVTLLLIGRSPFIKLRDKGNPDYDES